MPLRPHIRTRIHTPIRTRASAITSTTPPNSYPQERCTPIPRTDTDRRQTFQIRAMAVVAEEVAQCSEVAQWVDRQMDITAGTVGVMGRRTEVWAAPTPKDTRRTPR